MQAMTPDRIPHPLRFVHRGAIISPARVAPDRTLLALLREDLGLTAVKEGCNSGDCGACTVVLAQIEDGALRWRAVNSCLRLAHSVAGAALWTAADLGADPLLDLGGQALHPAQQAVIDRHGSQCGFCTPGFVMSLFALYQNSNAAGATVTRAAAQRALSGNLCRCTGYRPLLDAAQAMTRLPPARIDEARLLELLQEAQKPEEAQEMTTEVESAEAGSTGYLRPTTLAGLLQARAHHPDARLVAGATDLGLTLTKSLQRLPRLIDLTRVPELHRIERRDGRLLLGAAATLEDAFAALTRERPQLAAYTQRFAGLPIRNSGTLGGNIANGSPIGDSMPLLIALRATLHLLRWDGATATVSERRIALEDFYTGYRANILGADELLAAIEVPLPATITASMDWTRAYKVSKRFEDDISAVALALSLRIEDGMVREASIGAGGVAATPRRARRTEAALLDQPWSAATLRQAMTSITDEFEPLSDLRASAAYRRQVLANLLWRSWLESQNSSDARDCGAELSRLMPIAQELRP